MLPAFSNCLVHILETVLQVHCNVHRAPHALVLVHTEMEKKIYIKYYVFFSTSILVLQNGYFVHGRNRSPNLFAQTVICVCRVCSSCFCRSATHSADHSHRLHSPVCDIDQMSRSAISVYKFSSRPFSFSLINAKLASPALALIMLYDAPILLAFKR